MKRILLVVPYSIEVSGTLRLVTSLCESLRESGIEAHEYSVGKPDTRGDFIPPRNQWERAFSKPSELMQALEEMEHEFDAVFFAGVFHEKELRARQVQWCVNQKQSVGLSVGLLWERTGCDHVFPEDNLFLDITRNGLDRIFVLNATQRKYLEDTGIDPDLIAETHPGVDTKAAFQVPQPERRMELRRQYGWVQAKSIFLILSRFIERKRIEFVMEAWLNSPFLWNDSKLVVVGSGFGSRDSTEPLLEQLADRHSSIDLIKYRATMDPIAFYQAADAYVTASNQEGEPRSIIEAMACGLPVVASRIPGHESLVKHGKTGFLFGLDDRADLARQLHNIQKSVDQRRIMSENARIEVVETRDQALTANQLIRNLERKTNNSIIGGSSPPIYSDHMIQATS